MFDHLNISEEGYELRPFMQIDDDIVSYATMELFLSEYNFLPKEKIKKVGVGLYYLKEDGDRQHIADYCVPSSPDKKGVA